MNSFACLRIRSLHAALILVIGFLAYANTFNVPFTFDDVEYIVNNPIIRDFHYFSDHAGLDALPVARDVVDNFISRPATYFTFALNYRLHGLNVAGYHFVNLCLHLINALLVYLFVCLILTTAPFCAQPQAEAGGEPCKNRLPLWIALLFVCHPIQTQAVTYLIQRATSLATFFYLAALLLYGRSRLSHRGGARLCWYFFALLAAVGAMLSKEISFTLPVVLILFDLLFLEGDRRRRILNAIPMLCTMFIIPLAYQQIAVRGNSGAEHIGKALDLVNSGNISRWEYLLTQFRVIITYIRLLFFPTGQNLDYDYPLYHSLFEPTVIASFAAILALLCLGISLLYHSCKCDQRARGRFRLAGFGIVWFFITLSIESSIIPISDVIFEHRLYLPSVGFFIALFALAESALVAAAKNFRYGRVALLSVAAAAVCVLAIATYSRNTVWQDPLVFWQDVARKSPGKPRPHTQLGNALMQRGDVTGAVQEFRTVLRLNPNAYKAHNSLGIAYARMRRFDEAEASFLAALAVKPDYFMTHRNLGYFYHVTGRLDRAILSFRTALDIDPRHYVVRVGLAEAYLDRGALPEAVAELQKALLLQPNDDRAHHVLGIVYGRLGRNEEAREEFAIAAQLKGKGADRRRGPLAID